MILQLQLLGHATLLSAIPTTYEMWPAKACSSDTVQHRGCCIVVEAQREMWMSPGARSSPLFKNLHLSSPFFTRELSILLLRLSWNILMATGRTVDITDRANRLLATPLCACTLRVKHSHEFYGRKKQVLSGRALGTGHSHFWASNINKLTLAPLVARIRMKLLLPHDDLGVALLLLLKKHAFQQEVFSENCGACSFRAYTEAMAASPKSRLGAIAPWPTPFLWPCFGLWLTFTKKIDL